MGCPWPALSSEGADAELLRQVLACFALQGFVSLCLEVQKDALHGLANHENIAAVRGDAQAQVHFGWRCKATGTHCVLDFLDNAHDRGHACGSTCHAVWMIENTRRLPAFVPAPCPYLPCISRHRPAPVNIIMRRLRGGRPLEGGKDPPPPRYCLWFLF